MVDQQTTSELQILDSDLVNLLGITTKVVIIHSQTLDFQDQEVLINKDKMLDLEVGLLVLDSQIKVEVDQSIKDSDLEEALIPVTGSRVLAEAHQFEVKWTGILDQDSELPE